MKQTLLLLVLALGISGINVSAQTKKKVPIKRTTNTTSRPATVSITKERQVGKDGYIWYKTKKGNLYGAQDIEGKTIIPNRFSWVDYRCDERYGSHWFCVSNGDFKGAYTIEGDYVITTDRHYVDVILYGKKGKFAWVVKTNQGAYGLLDVRGNIVISPQYSGGITESGTKLIGCSLGEFSIGITHKNLCGFCDLNGNVIVEPIYKSCFESNGSLTIQKTGSDNYEKLEYKLPTSVKFDYNPFGGMYFDFNEQPIANSNSSSSQQVTASSNSSTTNQSSSNTPSSSNSSSSSNSNSGTTTVVVEHHRDPIPVQEWQACWACGGMGTMGCDNCGGSGTKYIGDRLHRCSRCNGGGIIPCNICHGNKGQYTTVYR